MVNFLCLLLLFDGQSQGQVPITPLPATGNSAPTAIVRRRHRSSLLLLSYLSESRDGCVLACAISVASLTTHSRSYLTRLNVDVIPATICIALVRFELGTAGTKTGYISPLSADSDYSNDTPIQCLHSQVNQSSSSAVPQE